MAEMDALEAMLESFYGMEDPEVAAQRAHDIDSNAFNVAEVASEVLSTKALPELIQYNRSLQDEARRLDGSMQELVRNNYTKFIAATDTIRVMKTSVTAMDSKMKGLVGDIARMGGSSETVNESLKENRQKIEKLIGIKRLLLKLEFLFELPLRLKRSIELDAQGQAVKYYTTVSGVLNKYDHIPSLHKIRLEADAIINGLRNDLRAVLKDKSSGGVVSSSSKVVEAIKLLVQLGEPRTALRAAYLKFQRSKLTGILSQFAPKTQHVDFTEQEDARPTPSPLLSAKSQSLFSAVTANKPQSQGAHILSPRPHATTPANTFLQNLNSNFLDAFKLATELYVELFEQDGAGDSHEAAEVKSAHEELIQFTKELFQDYFDIVKRQLSLPPPHKTAGEGKSDSADGAHLKKNPFLAKTQKKREVHTGEEGDDDAELIAAAEKARAQALAAALAMDDGSSDGRFSTVTDALMLLFSGIRTVRHPKEARLLDRAHEATEAVLRAQLEGIFADVRLDAIHQLTALREAAKKLLTEEKERAVRQSKPEASSNPFASQPKYDWVQTVGAGLSAAAEQASQELLKKLEEALSQTKPLVLSGMRLVPEMARMFSSIVHSLLVHMLLWLASAWEGVGDLQHPSRAEFAKIFVEADLGLDRESRVAAAGVGKAAGRQGHQRNATTQAPLLKTRLPVHFALAEYEGGGSLYTEPSSPEFLLLIACLCRHFSSTCVEPAVITMIKNLPSKADVQALGVSYIDSDMDASSSKAEIPNLKERILAAGKDVLRKFVSLHSSRISAVVRRSYTTIDWMEYEEPRDVRSLVQLILEDVSEVRKLVGCTLGDWNTAAMIQGSQSFGIGSANLAGVPPSPSNPFAQTDGFTAPPPPSTLRAGPGTGAHPGMLAAAQATRRTGIVVGAAGTTASVPSFGMSGMVSSNMRGNMALDIDRLFQSEDSSKSLKIVLGSVDYTSDSVVKVLLRCIFKAILEWIRVCKFNAFGYQQIQVDLGAFHLALPFFTCPPASMLATSSATSSVSGSFDPYAGAAVLEEMLNEAAMVARERCVDPRPIASTIVFKLGSDRLTTLQVAL